MSPDFAPPAGRRCWTSDSPHHDALGCAPDVGRTHTIPREISVASELHSGFRFGPFSERCLPAGSRRANEAMRNSIHSIEISDDHAIIADGHWDGIPSGFGMVDVENRSVCFAQEGMRDHVRCLVGPDNGAGGVDGPGLRFG